MTIVTTARLLTNVLSAQQFDRSLLEHVFARARVFDSALSPGAGRARQRVALPHPLSGLIMATLFYEPSTRTRLSFESAMLRLGGSAIGTEAARQFSSAIKGETLEDTIRVVSGYADVIVLRHDQAGGAARAAAVAGVPLINAGDGAGEHPTQALLDLFTVEAEIGHIEGVHVALCGDLRNGRTARSLALLLSLYPGVRITCVAPPPVQMGDDVLQVLRRRGVPVHLADAVNDVAADADVLYQTRIQKERFDDPAAADVARGRTRIDADTMHRVRPGSIILHPLPRVDEIAAGVDADPRAAYFRQAHRGVAVRMALLELLLA